MKHTQGEWKVEGTHPKSEVVIFSKETGTPICFLPVAKENKDINFNAKLIAAAPELLKLVQWITKVTNNPEIGIKCDAAIKKATE